MIRHICDYCKAVIEHAPISLTSDTYINFQNGEHTLSNWQRMDFCSLPCMGQFFGMMRPKGAAHNPEVILDVADPLPDIGLLGQIERRNYLQNLFKQDLTGALQDVVVLDFTDKDWYIHDKCYIFDEGWHASNIYRGKTLPLYLKNNGVALHLDYTKAPVRGYALLESRNLKEQNVNYGEIIPESAPVFDPLPFHQIAVNPYVLENLAHLDLPVKAYDLRECPWSGSLAFTFVYVHKQWRYAGQDDLTISGSKPYRMAQGDEVYTINYYQHQVYVFVLSVDKEQTTQVPPITNTIMLW